MNRNQQRSTSLLFKVMNSFQSQQNAVTALGLHFHPECYVCSSCGMDMNGVPFYVEENRIFCEYGMFLLILYYE